MTVGARWRPALLALLPAALSAAGGPGDGAAAEPLADAVYFLVAEKTSIHGDSYILPLTDSLDIAQARDLIAQGSGSGVGSIVSATIAAGGDGLNRDLLAPGEPLWSWHVTGFLGFADATIEVCDGWPTYVESDVQGWIDNTGGTICFWTYTVVEELDSVPVRSVSWGRLKQAYE